tara:strand:- start:68 stop:430 length:363 start_codon:yes stop_codon:yes gene_type:complete
MALADKKYETIHDKTGGDKTKLKDEFDNGYLSRIADVPEKEPAISALVYQIGLLQEDIDELRRYIVALAPSEKPLPTISTASHTVDFTVTNSKGAYTLVTTVVDSSSGKAVTKTATTTLR